MTWIPFDIDTFKTSPHTGHHSQSTMPTGRLDTKFVVPSTANYTAPPACTKGGVLCLRDDGDEHHPTQTNGWKQWTDSMLSSHTEHTHTTHHLSDTRSSANPTHTRISRTIARPDIIRSRNEINDCKGGCPDGYVCQINDDNSLDSCLARTAPLDWPGVSMGEFDVNARSDNGKISFQPCPDVYADSTCPAGQKCANVVGFDFFEFLVCVLNNTTLVSSRAETTGAISSVQRNVQPRSDDGHIRYRPCSEGCPAEEVCSELRGLDFLICLPDHTTAIRSHTEETGITRPCRVEDGVHEPDAWNCGDLIRNHTRFICQTGYQPMLQNGTCNCTPRREPYCKSDEYTMTFHTTLTTVYVAGQTSSGVTVVRPTYNTELASVVIPTNSFDSGPGPVWTSIAGVISEIEKRATTTQAPADCPLQYLNLTHSKPGKSIQLFS